MISSFADSKRKRYLGTFLLGYNNYMAEYALLDRITKEKISPEAALDERKKGVVRDYYCPNPDCNALLTPVKSDGYKHPNPFFRALKTRGHIEGCNYKSYYDEDAAKEKHAGLYESDFSIEVLLEKLKAYIPPEPSENASSTSPRKSLLDDEKEKILSSTKKLFFT